MYQHIGCIRTVQGKLTPVWPGICDVSELVGCFEGGVPVYPNNIGSCTGPFVGCWKTIGGKATPVLEFSSVNSLEALVESCCEVGVSCYQSCGYGYTPKYVRLTVSGVTAPLLNVCCDMGINNHKICTQAPLPNGTYILEQSVDYYCFAYWQNFDWTVVFENYASVGCTGTLLNTITNTGGYIRVGLQSETWSLSIRVATVPAFQGYGTRPEIRVCRPGMTLGAIENELDHASCPGVGPSTQNPYEGGTAVLEFL